MAEAWDPAQDDPANDNDGGVRKEVVLYTSHLHMVAKDKNDCKEARRLLSQKLGPTGYREVNFSEHEDPSERQNMESISGVTKLPQIFVDGAYIGGIDELRTAIDDGSFTEIFGSGDYFFGGQKLVKPGFMSTIKSWLYSFQGIFKPGNSFKGTPMWTSENTTPTRGGRPGMICQIVVFILLCLSALGSYYIYDEPATLQRHFWDRYGLESDLAYSASYVLYSFPNIFMPFFNGYVVHKLGRRWSMLLFTGMVWAGEGAASLGSAIGGRGGYGLFCCGRLFYGIAAEALMIAQLSAALKWFNGRTLGAVCVVFMSLPRLGSALCLMFASLFGTVDAIWWGNVFCAGSFCCCVAYIIIDMVFERFTIIYEEEAAKEDGSYAPRPPTVEMFPSSNSEMGKFRWGELKGLPRHFWIIMLANCCVAASVFPYIVFGNEYQKEKYDYSGRVACWNLSVIYWISLCVSPVLSRLIDQFGYRSAAVLLGCWLLVPAYPTLAFSVFDAFWATVWIGCGYAVMSAAVWPAASQAISFRHYGICYAILQSTQHLTLCIVYMSAAQIRDETLSYGPVLMYLGTFSLLLFSLSLNLIFENWTANRVSYNLSEEKGPKKVLNIFKRLDEAKGHNNLYGRQPVSETEALIGNAETLMASKNRRFRDAYMSKIGFTSYVNPPRR